MAIEIEQDSTPVAPHHWKWRLWLEGPSEELDQIEYVLYVLHPTFRDPIRRVENRQSGFMLQASGWGEFMVYITLTYKDAHTETHEHWVSLSADAPTKGARVVTGSRSPGKPLTVFVTAGLADSDLAGEMKQALQRRGIEVFSPDDISLGHTWQSELPSRIARADFGIAVISEEMSPWVQHEVAVLRRQQTPVISLMRGEPSKIPQSMQDLRTIHVNQAPNLDSLAGRIVDIMGQSQALSYQGDLNL